jgi:hypothetical protein
MEAVEQKRAVYGNQHPRYAASVCSLAGAYSELKRFVEAVALFEEALPIYQSVYGDKHKGTVGLIQALAGSSGCVGRTAQK